MPGMPITDRQVRRYMEQRRLGATQAVAAAKAGFSERRGGWKATRFCPASERASGASGRVRTRSQESGRRRSFRCCGRSRICAAPPFWKLCSGSILADLPTVCFARCIAHWRATEGPEQKLIFRQEHPPGEQALSDFTDASSLAVTIDGTPFPHLLYHFWLAFSGWQYVKAIQGGESFTALTEGLQEALWQLGGAPSTHRTDRLSAAYRNLRQDDDAAAGYRAFCDHYGLQPTRNNPGVSHENGSVEAAHGHLKTGLREALELRGSRDFADVAAYQAFLAEFVRTKNARRRAALQLELTAMRRLPRFRTTDFSLATVTVTRSGTISIRGVLYTVPSRLVGCRLKVHIYDDRLSCWLGTTQVLDLPRRHRQRRGEKRVRVVDYRHLAGALIRKPQAFRHSVFRDELFPRPVFRRTWEVLDSRLESRAACRVYVGLLHLAATHACEAALADHLEGVLARGGLPSIEVARRAAAPPPAIVPGVFVPPPDPAVYDRLFGRTAVAGGAI